MSDIPDAEPPNITARVLVPLALVACILALFLLVSGTLSTDENGGGDGAGRHGREPAPRRGEVAASFKGQSYVVQPGDTLSAIATKSQIPLARIERRNPDIDPATLNAGQEIKLR